ncbi:MAG: glycoside hydrolase family 13 protein [Anaerolineae bacterium]|nr:glycoside hydrolase family 13 protein [Anaerolineae bacterium]
MTTHPITPEWVKDAIFYQIFPDRFAASARVPKPSNLEAWDSPPTREGFKGGDLLGVLERLDYLEALGIDAIYFNPIFQSAANHRYHTYDYLQVDPILGGNDAFDALLAAAHTRSIRIVIDGVFNHASRGFFPFHHVMENGASSPYVDWFTFNSFPVNAYDADGSPNYGAWWGLPALPKLNTDNPQVWNYLMGVAEYWVRRGIDGWRLDVPLEITTPGFWEEFRRRVKAIDPETYILAEIWYEAGPWLQGHHFDATMNYPFNRACLNFFGGSALDTSIKPGDFQLQPITGTAFADAIDQLLSLYAWDVTLAQFNLLSSHDMARFLTMVGGDRQRLKLATLFQMAFPGAPSIYYGDEVGMEGADDPDCRRAFPWDEARWDHDLLDWFQRCTALRRAHPALRRGTLHRLHADESTYAFARRLEGETLVAAFNVGDAPATLTLPADLTQAAPFRDLLSGASLSLADGALVLPPLSASLAAATQTPS